MNKKEEFEREFLALLAKYDVNVDARVNAEMRPQVEIVSWANIPEDRFVLQFEYASNHNFFGKE
mgnify:CR=1 FL=1